MMIPWVVVVIAWAIAMVVLDAKANASVRAAIRAMEKRRDAADEAMRRDLEGLDDKLEAILSIALQSENVVEGAAANTAIPAPAARLHSAPRADALLREEGRGDEEEAPRRSEARQIDRMGRFHSAPRADALLLREEGRGDEEEEDPDLGAPTVRIDLRNVLPPSRDGEPPNA